MMQNWRYLKLFLLTYVKKCICMFLFSENYNLLFCKKVKYFMCIVISICLKYELFFKQISGKRS